MKKIYFILFLCLALMSGELFAQDPIWGVTQEGGSNGAGVIYRTNNDGTGYTVRYNLATPFQGMRPRTNLIQASDGKLYGVTSEGGANNVGVLFDFVPSTGVYTKRFDFSASQGSKPMGSLLQASNGKLYGTTTEGGAWGGVIFEYTISPSAYVKKMEFGPNTGWDVRGRLMQASNGKIYGMSYGGGATDEGVIFEYDITTNSYTKKIELSPAVGTRPTGNLIEVSGKLYGVTTAGGVNNQGTVIEYDLATGTCTKKHDFYSSKPSGKPEGSLIKATDGKLYGLFKTESLADPGSLFQFNTTTGVFSTTLGFWYPDFSPPLGGLAQATNGKLYWRGTNMALYEYDLITHGYTQKIQQMPTNEQPSNAHVMSASNGKLYCINAGGYSQSRHGQLFEYDLTTNTWASKVNFSYSTSGVNPKGPMVQHLNGKFYGFTESGGANGLGVIFEFTPTTNIYTKKVDLSEALGYEPFGRMVLAHNGKFYGVMMRGGANSLGALFEYDPTNNIFTKKVDLTVDTGSSPLGDLLLGSNGRLYGTTYTHGNTPYQAGTLFEYDPDQNVFSKKYAFGTPANGVYPRGSLTEGINGKLYGTTSSGGANSGGVVYEFDLNTNTYTKLYDFNSAFSGIIPHGVTKASNGKLYGFTSNGAQEGVGALFEYNTVSNTFTKLKDLDYYTTAFSYFYGATESSPGKLYAAGENGGSGLRGALLEYDVTSNVASIKQNFDWATGRRGAGLFIEVPNSNVTAPAPNAINQAVTVGAIARTIAGASTYTIEFNTSPQFNGTSIVKSGSYSQTFNLAYATTYYTRVKTNLSPTWGLTTRIATAPSEYFARLTAPANGATNVDVSSLSVQAAAVTHATTYTIQLSTDPSFVTNLQTVGSRTQVFSGLVPNQLYYARVKTDLSTAWGPLTTFTTGTAQALSYVDTPTNNSTAQLWSLNVVANTVTGASSYTIELAQDAAFTTDVRSLTSATPSIYFSGLAYGVKYYSRVLTDLNGGVWGPTRSFTTDHPLNRGYITAPANNSVDQFWNVSITGNIVQDATTYTVQLSPFSDFSSGIIESVGTRNPTFNALAYDTKYYVRVGTNLVAGWGPTRNFTTTNPVSAAYVTGPANGATGIATTLSVVVRNMAAVWVNSYTVELNTAADFTGTSIIKTNTSRTISFSGLAPGTTYYNRVYTNLAPNQWGPVRSFTTAGTALMASSTEPPPTTSSFENPLTIRVQQNPFNERLALIMVTPTAQTANVRLIDLYGKVIYESKKQTNEIVEIQTQVTSGLYILQVNTDHHAQSIRVTRQ